ncbi:MAG: hypothetical protein HC893_15015 [Chloroflexaceae bacterium]|nr:hypothetical protein [Chloroflexaceae bacterium]
MPQIILQVYERYGLLILSRLAALPVIVVMVGMWLLMKVVKIFGTVFSFVSLKRTHRNRRWENDD